MSHPAGVLSWQHAEVLYWESVGVWGLVRWDLALPGGAAAAAAVASSCSQVGATIGLTVDRSGRGISDAPIHCRPLGVAGEEECPERGGWLWLRSSFR